MATLALNSLSYLLRIVVVYAPFLVFWKAFYPLYSAPSLCSDSGAHHTVPLWALASTDRATLETFIAAGADLTAAVQNSYGSDQDSFVLYLIRRLENQNLTEEHAEISQLLRVIIPLLPNPIHFKTTGENSNDLIFSLLKYPELLKLWLERKPDLSIKAKMQIPSGKLFDGYPQMLDTHITLLGLAVHLDDPSIIQTLLSAGADVNATFEVSGTVYSPLAYAISRQAKTTLLLKSKGGVEIRQ